MLNRDFLQPVVSSNLVTAARLSQVTVACAPISSSPDPYDRPIFARTPHMLVTAVLRLISYREQHSIDKENKLKREREIGVSIDAGDNTGSLRARSHVQLDQPAG